MALDGDRSTTSERSIARGPPSSTVRVVENIVVTTATSTSGRVQFPRVSLYRSTNCVEKAGPASANVSADPNMTPAPSATKANASTAVPI